MWVILTDIILLIAATHFHFDFRPLQSMLVSSAAGNGLDFENTISNSARRPHLIPILRGNARKELCIDQKRTASLLAASQQRNSECGKKASPRLAPDACACAQFRHFCHANLSACGPPMPPSLCMALIRGAHAQVMSTRHATTAQQRRSPAAPRLLHPLERKGRSDHVIQIGIRLRGCIELQNGIADRRQLEAVFPAQAPVCHSPHRRPARPWRQSLVVVWSIPAQCDDGETLRRQQYVMQIFIKRVWRQNNNGKGLPSDGYSSHYQQKLSIKRLRLETMSVETCASAGRFFCRVLPCRIWRTVQIVVLVFGCFSRP